MSIWGIVVAGGTGSRFSGGANKLLQPLGDQPVLVHSVQALCQAVPLAGLVMVSHPQWEADYQETLAHITIPIVWVHGGSSRRESVNQGLQALPETTEIVLIHDAARPLVAPERIRAALAPVQSGQAMGTSLGVPSPNSIKRVDPQGWVNRSEPRAGLWQVHTPQVFPVRILLAAHQQVEADPQITDDAELLERLYPGQQAVLMVEDSPTNLKITHPSDLAVARALLSAPLLHIGPEFH